KIAWASDDGHDYEIKYWDGSTIRTVTDNGVSDSYVSLYNGAIAWVHDVTADSEIHYCEIDPPLKPAVETQSASDITDEAAQLNAMINPNEQDTAYMFEYGTSDGYGSETASTNLGDGSVGVEVNAALSGLQYSTTYHYRIVATNAAGVAYGSDQTFATQGLTPVLPTASTGSPTGTYESITMAATINPNGFETSYSFEYGTDTSYGSQTTSSSAGSGLEVVSVLSELDGLSSNTTYHYRIVATNAAGSVQGDDQSLTTMAVLAPTMMAPSGQQLIPYFPVALPIKDITPASARPFAVGDLLGGTLNLQVGLSAFSHAVDIYLGVQASVLGTDVLLIDSTGALQPLGSGLVVWKSNNFSGVDNEAVFGAIDVSTLPNDNYTLYLMVVPAGETHLMNYYLWKTDITINN
ncbi:MAG: fibronectin type III domain-containing protein, partial [Thermodesulfobacteriota bacterium]|nr:fibronectin type III domain-containing protein [Thermodesulfobacteriota bacterium]